MCRQEQSRFTIQTTSFPLYPVIRRYGAFNPRVEIPTTRRLESITHLTALFLDLSPPYFKNGGIAAITLPGSVCRYLREIPSQQPFWRMIE